MYVTERVMNFYLCHSCHIIDLNNGKTVKKVSAKVYKGLCNSFRNNPMIPLYDIIYIARSESEDGAT